MTSIFEKYKYRFAEMHKEVLQTLFTDSIPELQHYYSKYTVLDNNYPRPLLTLLGMNYMSDVAPAIDNCSDPHFLILPQLVRDVLAIHDDIIDEDLTKFQQDTLPFAFSKMYTSSATDINKEGKDFALLFGDYLYPIIYKLVLSCNVDPETKISVISCINNVMIGTNVGQLDELMMQHKPLTIYSSDYILEMYQKKAADYCYAFPFTLGAIYAGAPQEMIDKTRDILLRIGATSQIIDDMMGIFPEALDDAKSTLSDLIYLRRSYLLQLLSEFASDDSVLQGILAQSECTEEQALFLKERIISTGTLKKAVSTILSNCNMVEKEIDELSLGSYCKSYFKKLLDARVRSNLECLVLYFKV